MNYHVGGLGTFAAGPLLDRPRARVGAGQGGAGVETESEVGEQAVVRAEEAQLTRRAARLLPDDALDEIPVGVVGDHASPLPLLRQRLEVRLHPGHVGYR